MHAIISFRAVVFNLGSRWASDKNVHNSKFHISYMEPLLVVAKYDDHLKEMITYFFIQNSFMKCCVWQYTKNFVSLHFTCLTGNFRKGVFRLNWVAKWVAAWKRLKTTALGVQYTLAVLRNWSTSTYIGIIQSHRQSFWSFQINSLGLRTILGLMHQNCVNQK